MKKVFIIKGWTPYDLLGISKDGFYNVAECQYKIQFNIDINISYMDLVFVSKNKIKVTLIEFNKVS